MRWVFLFFLILGLMLWLTGIVQVNLPPSLAFLQNYMPKHDASSSASSSWLPSAVAPSTTYHMEGCTVDVPAGWTVRSNTAYNLTIGTNGKGFVLKTIDINGRVDIDSAAFSNQMLSQSFGYGVKVISENRDRFLGCPAYTVLLTKDQSGATVYSRVTLFNNGGQGYLIVSSLRDADPAGDSQLAALVNSVKIAY